MIAQAKVLMGLFAANNSRGTATSVIWNVTYFACRTTLCKNRTKYSDSLVRKRQNRLTGTAPLSRRTSERLRFQSVPLEAPR